MTKKAPLLYHIKSFAAEKKLWSSGDSIVVACSGGGDSTALLLLLHELAGEEKLQLTVAHLHHGIRGEEADADAQFVEEISRKLGLPLEIGRCDVPEYAREHKLNPYEAGRLLRQQFLGEVARKVGTRSIALGHTMDDRAETLLVNLLHGSGLIGLCAMRPRRGVFIRPLLATQREELREYLQEREQPWQEDSSNIDGGVRARLRRAVFPLFDKIGSVDSVEMLGRAAENLAEDEDLLEDWGRNLALGIGIDDGLAMEHLSQLLPALARRVVLAKFGEWMHHHTLSRERWGKLWAWITAGGRGNLQIPGFYTFTVENGLLKLILEEGLQDEKIVAGELTVPGRLTVAFAGIVLVACSPGEVPEGADAIFGRGPIPPKVTVRSRQPGDRIKLAGGTKKIQDLLVDAKVPRRNRNGIPLVMLDGKVIWAVSVAKAGEYVDESGAKWAIYTEKLSD